MNALLLFKGDMGAFVRLYTFLSQMFDFGNTAIETRSIFYRRLIPLLEFGREREGVDLSKVELTHHKVVSKGDATMTLGTGERPKLAATTEAGTGQVQDKEKATLQEIVEQMNMLFNGELTDGDRVAFVRGLKSKMMENGTLARQARSNTKQQFANSPDLGEALVNAIIDAYAAHSEMSKQALNDQTVREGLKGLLLGPAQLYEALRGAADGQPG